MPAIKAVVFGTRFQADRWARENDLDPAQVILASEGPDKLRGHTGDLAVFRVSKERWTPPTSACERRCRETEEFLKRSSLEVKK